MAAYAAPTTTGRRRFLTLWVTGTVLVCVGLGVLAWVIAHQARALEAERGRDATERLLLARRDTVSERVSALRTWLAEVSTSSTAAQAPNWLDPEQLLLLHASANRVRALAGRYLFRPDAIPQSDDDGPFLQIERAELARDGGDKAVVDAYARLQSHGSANVRAGASVRLSRLLERRGEASTALAALQALAESSDGEIDGVSAPLVARIAMVALLERMGRVDEAAGTAAAVARGLELGEWSMPAGAWRFYGERLGRHGVSVSPPSKRLALTLAAQSALRLPAQSDAPTIIHTSSGPVLVLARNDTDGRLYLLAAPGALLPPSVQDSSLMDAEGRVVAGQDRPADSVLATRIVTVPVGAGGLLLQAPVTRVAPPWHLRGDVMTCLAAALVIGCLGAGSWGLGRGVAHELQLNALQSQFIAAVSHELRTPITSLRYMTDMLLAGRVPGERLGDYYGVLGRESRRLQSTIESLLQFGRLESGVTHLQRERLSASWLVRTAVDDFQAGREGATPQLHVTEEERSAHVLGDMPALLVALRNLIDNAVKYSPGADLVEISTTADAEHVHVRVRDFGPGLAPDEHTVIFRRFTRGTAAERTGAPGTGLGLALSQHVATVHGGVIAVEHSGPGGTVFALRLPLAP